MDTNIHSISSNKIIDFLLQKRCRVLRHLIFSLGFITFLYYSNLSLQFSGVYQYYWLIIVYTIFILMFYVNMYILVSLFLQRNYITVYFILLVVMISAGLGLMSFLIEFFLGPHRIGERPVDVDLINIRNGLFVAIPFVMTSTTVKLFQQWVKDNERIAELQNLTLKMELKELKNQINPHFLFNMLNNIKALTRTNPEMASQIILRLSEFLRYQLYENNEEKTSLVAEINFLSNFANLEKIRRDNFSFNIENKIDPKKLRSILIYPNLFIVFVENAIKHSVDIRGEESFIKIEFDYDAENKKLYFACINSKNPDYVPVDKKNSGLGLINIKRRLDLLYRTDYNLTIKSDENKYTVNLTLPL